MKHLKISKYSVRLRNVYFTSYNQKLLDTKITILVDGKHKYTEKVLPVQPSTHVETLLKIHKDAYLQKITILPIVTTYIIGKMGEQRSNTVTILYEEMVEDLQASRPTLLKAFTYLQENNYISKIGQSSYKISPMLAFYGGFDQWAIAISAHNDNLSDEEKEKLLSQLNREKDNVNYLINGFQISIEEAINNPKPLK